VFAISRRYKDTYSSAINISLSCASNRLGSFRIKSHRTLIETPRLRHFFRSAARQITISPAVRRNSLIFETRFPGAVSSTWKATSPFLYFHTSRLYLDFVAGISRPIVARVSHSSRYARFLISTPTGCVGDWSLLGQRTFLGSNSAPVVVIQVAGPRIKGDALPRNRQLHRPVVTRERAAIQGYRESGAGKQKKWRSEAKPRARRSHTPRGRHLLGPHR